MELPETITKVFTKYDGLLPGDGITIQREIGVQTPIPDSDIMTSCYGSNSYRLSAIKFGLEDVVFAYYDRIIKGGFIGEGECTIIDCRCTGDMEV